MGAGDLMISRLLSKLHSYRTPPVARFMRRSSSPHRCRLTSKRKLFYPLATFAGKACQEPSPSAALSDKAESLRLCEQGSSDREEFCSAAVFDLLHKSILFFIIRVRPPSERPARRRPSPEHDDVIVVGGARRLNIVISARCAGTGRPRAGPTGTSTDEFLSATRR